MAILIHKVGAHLCCTSLFYNHQCRLRLVHHPQLESRNNFYPHWDLNTGPSTQKKKELMPNPLCYGAVIIYNIA